MYPIAANPSGFEEYPQYNSPYDPNSFFISHRLDLQIRVIINQCHGSARGKNNLKNFLNNELITTHNISIAGKNENADYRISVTHMYQKGQVPNTQLELNYCKSGRWS